VLVGDVATADRMTDLPWSEESLPDNNELLVLVPYRQVAERGFECLDDGTPLRFLRVSARAEISVAEALSLLPSDRVRLVGGEFDIADAAYSEIVRRVLRDEIGAGQGSNFVIKRSYIATVENYSIRAALAMFRALLEHESGTYWTFLVHTGERTLLGASPERHLSVLGDNVLMNPISGTYRYPPAGPNLDDLLGFLADQKETDELYMVVDEELKMMARVCDGDVRVIGPRLREMAKLAHTEYDIAGTSTIDLRTILRETLFAPTVTGSPVENAGRVIRRYEQRGRGYYSGVLAHLGRAPDGRRLLDSAILIRTADIDSAGRLDIGVGATLVRHSDPDGEVAETRTKVAGLLGALDPDRPVRPVAPRPRALGMHPAVRTALTRRNARLARFWLDHPATMAQPVLPHRKVVVIDAEDTFTAMLAHQLRSFGLTVVVRDYGDVDDVAAIGACDLVVLGPGPGDPCDGTDPKIAKLTALTAELMALRFPTLAVCLSHQVLCRHLGLPIVRREVPNQGTQAELDLFGTRARMGFYNTFAAVADRDVLTVPDIRGPVEISRDAVTNEVFATRGPFFRSVQFHPESILSEHGVAVLVDQLGSLFAASVVV
jgi:phenazine biosynthesis protein phzE